VKLVLALALISLATATTAVSDGPAGTLPGDTPVPFWPHETGALVGTSETFVDVHANGSYFDPSVGRRVPAGVGALQSAPAKHRSRAGAEVTATESASAPPRASSRGARPVRFVTTDGVELVGQLSGTGDVGVILAHGFSHGVAQDAWLRFVPALVSRRYMVLTFNFRGFCGGTGCSDGPSQLGKNWLDVMAAAWFIKTRGAKKIFLVGASMGGLAVLRAARMVDVAGVVSLSTPQFPSKYYTGEPRANDVTPALLRQIDEPKLFVAGTKDVQLPGTAPLRPGVKSVRFAADARRMFAAAKEPKKLVLVDSPFHSSDLVTTAVPASIVRQTRAAVFRFLSENS
jgi:pimeloyl-ACP methyl ester carboxylesterase